MAEQKKKKPSAFDGVTGKTTPGARGPAQSPVSPVTEALYQPREYDKQETAKKNAPESWTVAADVEGALGLRSSRDGEPMHAFDLQRAYADGDKLYKAFTAAGVPPEAMPYHMALDMGLAIQAKERLEKGQVAPRYEGLVRDIAAYVPSVNAEYADKAKKVGLQFDVPPVPQGYLWNPEVAQVLSDAELAHMRRMRQAAPDYTAPNNRKEYTLPETQRALQRIAEATPPAKKK